MGCVPSDDRHGFVPVIDLVTRVNEYESLGVSVLMPIEAVGVHLTTGVAGCVPSNDRFGWRNQ
jgi:hypothetical protein